MLSLLVDSLNKRVLESKVSYSKVSMIRQIIFSMNDGSTKFDIVQNDWDNSFELNRDQTIP